MRRARHTRSSGIRSRFAGCFASRFAGCFGTAFAVYLLVGAPSVARACSVCFGNPDSPHTQGMRGAIFFLLTIIGGVLVAFAAFFLRLRRLSRLAGADLVSGDEGGGLPRRGSLPGGSSGRIDRKNGTHSDGR